MKKILIVSGGGRPNGNTAQLLTLPMPKGRGFLLPATICVVADPFISARSQCKVWVCHYPSQGRTHSSLRSMSYLFTSRAELIVPCAVCRIYLPPTYLVELQMFIAPNISLWMWNPHLQV